ncbi:MAG: site-specific integrase [Oscillospiraceae bacterium]|nr:site-specific integrase [Oscillospiraceae bacterium]
MTKRANNEGTIYKKTVTKNGKTYTYWESQVTVGSDPGTGKRIRKTFSAKTQKAVKEKMQNASTAIQKKEYFEPSTMSTSNWLNLWLDEYTSDKKYLTIKHYKAQIETHIKPALGATRLGDLKASQIQKFYNELMRSGHEVKTKDKKTGKITIRKEPLSAKSVRNIHGILTKTLNTAVDIGYLRSNPADRVTLPRVEKKEIRPLDDAQIIAYYAAAAEDEYCYLLRIIPFTGLREAEAMGLTWDCVDFNAGTLKINKQLIKRPNADGGFTLAETKSSKIRIIKPAATVMQLLKARQQQQIDQKELAGDSWEGWKTEKEKASALVFTTATGKNLSPQTVYNHCKKILKKIGAEDRCVHDLRHTYAVLSLQNGDDIKTVQGNLGHATAAFTLDVYGHVSEKMKDDSAARMESFISSFKKGEK